jgi:hypothetical protein
MAQKTYDTDESETEETKGTRYIPAKWVASPSKLLKMMVDNVGKEKFRVEVKYRPVA